MPIYEYRCRACGFEKEYLQKHADAPIEVCERCGQAAMSKLLSAAGFQLKGSGWYATDFKNAGAKPKPTGESDGQEASSGKEGKDAKDTKDSKDTKDTKAGKESKDSKESTDSKGSKDSSAERTTPSSGAGAAGASVG
jgi:putative FmdB family regulatory protein